MKNKKNLLFTAVMALVVALVIGLMLYNLFPLLQEVASNADDETRMIDRIRAYGSQSVVVLIGLFILQVITAFIPAAPIQALTGLCCGVWRGLLVCLVGCNLGNALVFCCTRHISNTITPYITGRRQKKERAGLAKYFSLSYINSLRHPELIAFVLYFLPGIPNGFLPYIFARTNVPLWRYLLVITSASVPSILFCTVVGERLASGDLLTALILLGIFLVLTVLLLIFRKPLFALVQKRSDDDISAEALAAEGAIEVAAQEDAAADPPGGKPQP